MEANFSIIANSLTWTIIHSLWQGGILFILLLSFFTLAKKSSARLKFLVSFVALIILFLVTLSTFVYKVFSAESAALYSEKVLSIIQNFSLIIEINNSNNFSEFINNNTYQITSIWLIGTALFFLKYLISYFFLLRLRRNNSVLDISEYNIDIYKLCSNLGINKSISVKNYSELISPFTAGFIKPVIFFPVSLLNRLSTQEIECILAHELAHIKRFDYLTNTISSIIEVILYYHPLVWWIQKQMSIYREEACDDIAIKEINDPLLYAKSLVKLQELLNDDTKIPALSLGFMNDKKSNLLNRIKRMFNMSYSPINIKEKLAASIFIFLFALGITELYAFKTEKKELSFINNLKDLYQNPLDEMANDTIPKSKSKKKEKIAIIKDDGNQKIDLKLEDGEIKALSIDGKEIPKEDYDKYRAITDEVKLLDGKAFIFDGKDGLFSFDDFGMNMMHPEEWEKNSEKWKEKNEKWQEKLEKWQEKHHKDMERMQKDMFRMGEDSRAFVYPNGMSDSMFQMYRFNADSLKKMADVYRGQADSLQKFHFAFPKGFDQSFKIMIPEDGMDFELPEFDFDFDFDFPDHNFDEGDFDVYNHENDNRNEDEIKHKWDSNNLENLIGKQLNRDGFLVAGKDNKVELSGKHLKINGEKQPSNIWNKYKNLFERETGMPLNKDTKLVFNIEGKESKRKYKAF